MMKGISFSWMVLLVLLVANGQASAQRIDNAMSVAPPRAAPGI